MEEKSFISCKKNTKWKPPVKLTDCSAEYLAHCPVDYSLLRNPFNTKPEELNPREEEKLWQCLGIVRAVETKTETPAENPFFSTSVPALNSKRELKRMRQADRRSKLEKWYDMAKPNVTEEEKDDLEVLRLRRAITSDTHVRRSDTKAKYFQTGVVIDDPGNFYDRIPRKQRGRTLVDELLANAELMKKQRKRYSRVEQATGERRAAEHRQKQQRLKRLKQRKGRNHSAVLLPT